MSNMFIKTKEDFVCKHCGAEVVGDGFTNHCPYCLWSKHVDLFPGDRKAWCGGMMKPAKFEKAKKEYVVTHECILCGHVKRNKINAEDDFDKALEIVSQEKR